MRSQGRLTSPPDRHRTHGHPTVPLNDKPPRAEPRLVPPPYPCSSPILSCAAPPQPHATAISRHLVPLFRPILHRPSPSTCTSRPSHSPSNVSRGSRAPHHCVASRPPAPPLPCLSRLLSHCPPPAPAHPHATLPLPAKGDTALCSARCASRSHVFRRGIPPGYFGVDGLESGGVEDLEREDTVLIESSDGPASADVQVELHCCRPAGPAHY